MRIPILLALAAAFVWFPSDRDRRVGGEAAAVPVAESPKPETQPSGGDAKKPAKVKTVDDEIKTLALKPMKVGVAMDKLKKVEKQLKGWADAGATEFDDARKAGVLLAAMCKTVEWKKEKKREKDAQAFDQIVTELDASARKLADAAAAKDAGAGKSSAAEIGQRCSDCHGKFK
jgi:hypothetical protein